MGTNYYLNDRHIGKSSAGWYFALHIYPEENINSLDEVIPGVAINKQTKVQMFESITKAVQDKQGRTTNAIWAKRAEDPMFFDERLAYLFATGFFEKGKPWVKAGQAKTTKEISDLADIDNKSPGQPL